MKKHTKLNILRHILCTVLFICLAFSAFSVQALAANDAGANIEWTMGGNTLVISGHGAMRDFSEHNVPPWHEHRDKIRAIIIEDGVTSVGDLAFYKYENLVSVILGSSVKDIGEYAFSDCTSLEMISLGGVNHIQSNAFARCFSLKSIRLPKTLQSIDDKAFYRCSSLLSVHIPESVSHLGNMIFTYCDKLVGASIHAKVDSVPEWTFLGCESLSEVVLGDNITSAEDRAFYGCESLTALYYPSENENTLVESIKSTSIETFSDQYLIGDSPANGEFNGASAVVNGNRVTQSESTLSQSNTSTIAIDVTEQFDIDKEGFHLLSSIVSIDALIDSEAGWSELLTKIQYMIEHDVSSDGYIYVHVNLQVGKSIPSDVLTALRGKSVQLDVRLWDGTLFGIDCQRIELNEDGNVDQPSSLGCNVTADPSIADKYNGVLEGSETYKVTFDGKIDINFSSKIFVGKDNASSIATIYVEDANGGLNRVQSAIIDKNGYATFYLRSVSESTEIFLGINVKGETAENAIIPDSLAIDNVDLLDRYRPMEYAVIDDRNFLGLNSWQFALAVSGVILGITLIVSIIAVMIYRKKKLQLLHKLNNGKR